MSRHSLSGRAGSTSSSRTTSARQNAGGAILPTARLSIRAPAYPLLNPASRRLKPRRVFLIVLSLSVGIFFWRKTGEWARQAELEDLEEKCRLYPWMAKCVGGAWAVQDPFEGLHFEKEGGHLFYPAHSASEDDTAIPPDQPHPIHLLISDAKRDWSKKVSRQSRTVREAVEEYERRYGMRPPKGFGAWFEFAQANNFVLVDEFDSLHRKILPFLSLPSSILRERSEMLQHDKEFWLNDKTFTVRIRHDARSPVIDAVGPMRSSGNGRADQMVDLLSGIAEKLPPMNITFTGHDVPWIGLAGAARAKMIAAAEAGEFIDEASYGDYQDNWDIDGWASICAPGSPLKLAKGFESRQEDWTPPRPSFIYDHVAAMDTCNHPDEQPLHGFTAWPGPRPGLLYPIFSFTGTTFHADLLATPIDQYDVPIGDDPDWEDKTVNKIVWRGSTTGADLNIPHMRKWSQRPRLCSLSHQQTTLTLPFAPNDTPGNLGATELFSTSSPVLASNYFDFRFLGRPEQCGDPVACEEFRKRFVWDEWMTQEDQNLYKYVIDVDGNGWSGRFFRLLSSKTMVLKSTIFPEWYADHIQPWLHYVPVSVDYTDLWAIMAFFRGGKHGEGAHDELAKEIAYAGKDWAEKHWRMIDMQIYMYRLLIEYDRAMNRDPNDPRSMDM